MSLLRVKEYLDKNQESARQLAKASGIARSTIGLMIHPDKDFDPKLSSLLAVANHYNCRVEDLISETAYRKKGEDYEIC